MMYAFERTIQYPWGGGGEGFHQGIYFCLLLPKKAIWDNDFENEDLRNVAQKLAMKG
jgi:hypothetical protein